MKTRAAIVRLLAILALGIGGAWAEEDHKAEAMKHAEAAVASGAKQDAAGVGEHAAAAKSHAEAAQKERANPHLDATIDNLGEAVKLGKAGDAAGATKAVEAGITHLKAAQKAF